MRHFRQHLGNVFETQLSRSILYICEISYGGLQTVNNVRQMDATVDYCFHVILLAGQKEILSNTVV